MLVPFDVVQDEDAAVAGRELADGVLQGNPVDDGHAFLVFGPPNDLHGGLALFGREFRAALAAAKVHQDLIDGHAVQPGGEGGIAAKAPDLVEELDESFLREVSASSGLA